MSEEGGEEGFLMYPGHLVDVEAEKVGSRDTRGYNEAQEL